MVMICRSVENRLVEGWNNDQLSELEAGRGDCAAKGGQVILVAASDLLDKAMGAQALEHSRQLRRRDSPKAGTEGACLESADGELATSHGLKEVEISAVEEIETAIAPVAVVHRRGDFFQRVEASAGIIDSRQEVEVAIGSRAQEMMQRGQAVDGLAHGSELEFRGPVAMFHRAVVLEKGHVIGGAFHTPDQAELVVELDGHGPHMMLDARALNAGVEVVADLPLVGGSQFASQESDDVLRLDGLNGGVSDSSVERLEVSLAPEDHVGGVLHLHQAPVIPRKEVPTHRAVLPRDLVQVPMESLYIQGIGQRLGMGEVGNVDEGIVEQSISDSFLLELDGQLVMAVEIELQTEWRPGGYPQVAKPQFRVK